MQLKNVQNDYYVNAIYKFIFSIEIYIKLVKKQGGLFAPQFPIEKKIIHSHEGFEQKCINNNKKNSISVFFLTVYNGNLKCIKNKTVEK